ncbi:hypothetical protein K438DRAFT_1995909 [Mycena galopus ATCC 62051]|nr:hypothetical protein K438DRAFT_1995909 [Mycena galopus ATCC 62051]
MEEPSTSAAISERRVRIEHHAAPPPSPEKNKAGDAFDDLMGFDGDTFMPEVVTPEGPAALKIKVKKRYENSDHPVKTWIPERDAYLDSLLQLKGRGPWWSKGNGKRDISRRGMGKISVFGFRSGILLHNNGIHMVDVDFCGCTGALSEAAQLLNVGWYLATHKEPSTAATLSLLHRFHKLNLQGRIPAYDFYNTLVLLMNGAGSRKVLDRLQQFMNMVHEYRHLQMCKRAGWGHDPGGISATQPGELAIPCRACPQPDINLPKDWDKAPPEVAWIYRLLVSKDANFKLKGRAQSTREKDPMLGPGWAYMVENTAYLKYLAEHIHEDEITHCVSFAVLWSANNKHAKGLRASGVGSMSCSRHEMFRALGTGDLQRGEKYPNMDYLWFSALMGVILLTLVASYDIACQWRRNFWKRAKKMPKELWLPDWVDVVFEVPKFHLQPHITKCTSLLRKMVLAIPQAIIHNRAFHAFTEGLREGHEEDLAWWEKMVRDWEVDMEANEDPYNYAEVEATTMADVLAQIAAEEHACVVREGVSALTVKPGPFLIEGIEIQQAHTPARGKMTEPNNHSGDHASTLVHIAPRKVRSATTRYRAARIALLALRGLGAWENELQELRKEDIRGMTERALNDEEKEENKKVRWLAGLPEDASGEDINEYGEPVELTVLFNLETSEGRRNLSWIWYTGGVKDSDVTANGKLHEDIRVEWTKARGRAECWREELLLLEEEMRRVLEFCSWKALWWAERESTWERDWEKKWAAVREHAKVVMRDQIVDVEDLVPLEVELEEEVEDDDKDDEM